LLATVDTESSNLSTPHRYDYSHTAIDVIMHSSGSIYGSYP